MPGCLPGASVRLKSLCKPPACNLCNSLLIAFLAVLLFPAAPFACGQSELPESEALAMKAVVQEYIAGYSAMNPDRTSACIASFEWDPKQIRNDQANYFATLRSIEYRNVVISSPRFDPQKGSNHEIEVKADLYTDSIRKKKPSTVPTDTIYVMVKEGAAWKILFYLRASERLADELLSQLTREERQDFLRKNRDRLDRDLVQSLVNRLGQPGRDDPRRILDIAMETANALGDPNAKGSAQMACGFYKSMHNDPGGSIDCYVDAFQFWSKTDNIESQAFAKGDLADQFGGVGRWPEAEKAHREAVALFRESGDEESGLDQRTQLGRTEAAQGRKDEAEAELTKVIQQAEEKRYFFVETAALSERAQLYSSEDRRSDALADLKKSIEVSRNTGNPQDEAARRNGYARALVYDGRYEESITVAKEAAKFAEENRLPEIAGMAFENEGRARAALGQDDEALKAFSDALRANDLSPQAMVAAHLHGEIADVLSRDFLSNNTAVGEELSYAEEAAKQSADMRTQAEVDIKLGQFVVHMLTLFEPVLQRMKIDPEWKSQFVQNQIQEYEKKRPTLISFGQQRLDRVVNTAASTKNPNLEAEARAVRAEFYAAIGSDEKLSEQEASAAIDAAQRARDAHLQLVCFETLARVLIMEKKWEKAIRALQSPILQIENIRAGVRVEADRTSYFAANTWPYRALALAQVENSEKNPADRREAFITSERVRARALEEALVGGTISATRQMTAEEHAQDQTLANSVTTAELQLESLRRARTSSQSLLYEAENSLAQARANQDRFRSEVLLRHSSSFDSKSAPGVLDTSTLDDGLDSIGQDTAVLEYLISDEFTLLFVVKKYPEHQGKPGVRVIKLPVSRYELQGAISRLRTACENPNLPYQEPARKLYDVLIAPAEKYLEGLKHWVIVPDGELALLPFQALRSEKGFVMQSVSVSYAPSVAALGKTIRLAEKRRKEWQSKPAENQNSALAMGAPNFPPGFADLPEARAEVTEVAGIFGAHAYLGAEATRQTALKLLPQVRYVHLATHSRLDPNSSLRSAIVLSRTPTDDGFLEAQDLLNENLQSELVVLSACNTGSGRSVNGEGLQGLSWALFMAGSPANMVTQWEVSDKSTRILMKEFYRQLLAVPSPGKPVNKSDALRAAQLKLIAEDKKYAHPYYWAPFILTGAAN